MLETQLSTKRLVMLACSVVLGGTLAGCGSDYSAPNTDPPPTVVQTPAPTAPFIGVVNSTINTANAGALEPSTVDPAPAPTTETEEPVPVT